MGQKFEIKWNYLIITMDGELDHYMAEQIRIESDRYLRGSRIRNVIFDFRNVTFMDSSGIGVIMGRYKQVKPFDGKVYVIHCNARIKQIFLISGLNKLVEQKNSVEEIMELDHREDK